jgi:hypothetical protein
MVSWSIELANMFQRAVPAAAGVFAIGCTLFPRTALHAEAPDHVEVQLEVRLFGRRDYQLRALTSLAAEKAYLR